MVEQEEEASWLARARQGDPSASRQLVRAHAPALIRYARRLLRDAGDAEDAAQEAFLRLFRDESAFDGRSQLRTWLFRVVHNLAVDRLRRRRETGLGEEEPPTSRPSQGQLLHAKREAEHLREQIATLPERQGEALMLVHFEGMSQTEASEALGITVEALESLLARARRALRKALHPPDPVAAFERSSRNG